MVKLHKKILGITGRKNTLASKEDTTNRLLGNSGDFDFEALLTKYKNDPFDYIDICSVHTGQVSFKVQEGDEVVGPSGEWDHIPGTLLYEINRERNPKNVMSEINGVVSEIHSELDREFVEAGERLLTVKHPLSKKEVIETILKEVLTLFPAPETAKYFFGLEVQNRIDKQGVRSVIIDKGDEILTMSLMKRDTAVCYEGERGAIYSIYFQPGDLVQQGEPILGVCAPEKLPLIKKIIARVQADWDT